MQNKEKWPGKTNEYQNLNIMLNLKSEICRIKRTLSINGIKIIACTAEPSPISFVAFPGRFKERSFYLNHQFETIQK